MGYTIAMSAKSVQAADEMLAFMGEQFRPGTEILDSDYNYDCTRDGLLRDNHLAYDEGTTKLGFNYSGGGNGSRHYAYCVCRWMALKVGRSLRDKKLGDHDVPHIRYDGFESTPVLVEAKWEGTLDASEFRTSYCDQYGVKEPPELHMLRMSYGDDPPLHAKPHYRRYKRFQESITEELQRLDRLWKEQYGD